MENQERYRDKQMQSTSLASLQEKNSLQIRYGDREQFLKTFNPDLQVKVGNDAERCLFSTTPTLSELNCAYGSETASIWLVLQLNSLSEFCGCKDKLTGGSLKECSILLSREYYYLKVSELILFFYQFKCGMYGKFYGAVDPLVITTAMREFIIYRNEMIARKENEDAAIQRREERKKHITHEQWVMMKKGISQVCSSTKTYFTKQGVKTGNELDNIKKQSNEKK